MLFWAGLNLRMTNSGRRYCKKKNFQMLAYRKIKLIIDTDVVVIA